VMAYVNGQTLGEHLRARGPLSAGAATRLLREVTWALSYAHGHGIVHRDIKPDNILIEAETGRAMVTDFGIARGEAETQISDPGRVMGTAHFMSPEQASGDAIDGRSDLYSLGVVGYLALSGTLPFDGSSVPAVILKHVAADVPSLAAAAPSTPRALVEIVERCLRKDRAERFASGEVLAESLDAAATPARAKLPMALRVWTQAVDPLRPVYMAWSGVFTMGLLSELRSSRDWPVVLAFDLLPLIPITIFHARRTYQALAAGYSLRDLRAALAAWQQERREERAFELDERESMWAKGMRFVTYGLGASVAVLLFAGIPRGFVSRILFGAMIAGAGVTLTLTSALGVRMITKRVRLALIGGLRSTILNSRLGEWAVKLLTPARRAAVADFDFRPTEMALGIAVDELFAALPTVYRDHVSDLPRVVERLEAHAAAARARADEIASLMAMGGDASVRHLGAGRDAAKRELADSVAALEAIRLDLLRLHGGASDLQPITTVLEAARELGEELDRLSHGKDEADRTVRQSPFDLTPHTPI
ncbi:MAG TPA: serine/threonine-protein kinase, partial [Gemmatimonadaceae bacterium]|nr:serine/threonine-protein kinase [Gemmatimonadaceae bacterium]